MHEVYKLSPLLKHTNMQIECITSYDEYLLLGTRQGSLLMYNVVKATLNDEKPEIQLMRFNKSFSKKPIQQLDVIPEYNVLISLTDNIIQVHDINSSNFATTITMDKTRGATLFTIDVNKQVTMTGKEIFIYRMCVYVKKKLQFYVWAKKEFLQLENDVPINDVPKALAWCQNTICVGNKNEYSCYQLKDKWNDLFPTSSNQSNEPFVIKASETTFALVRDKQTFLVNDQGGAEKSKILKWSGTPHALVWDEPYCVALIGETAEVHAIEAEEVIQSFSDLGKIRFVSRAQQGLIYGASIGQVWLFRAIDIQIQRNALLENKQFELALKLTSVSDETEDEKQKIIYDIQTLLAYELFNKKKYHQSMKEFLELGTNVHHVIRLFPDLLPPQNDEPKVEVSSHLSGKELEEGLTALIEYLTSMRFKYAWEAQQNLNTTANMNNVQIIDTTLLKCYLQTNDALVAPLLRSNNCHLAEAERTLKKYKKNNELIILYQTKGQHRRALELLKTEGNMDRTIKYLQHLGNKDMGLILEYADWVLNKSPEDGLKIFIEDNVDVEDLPRPRVLDYLLKSHIDLSIPYLEHVINFWKDTNPLFHNSLIHKYREKVLSDEPGVEITKKKLLDFLENSEHYKPETVLLHFPPNALLEERALIYGKLGRHDDALGIYVRALGDIDKAVTHCKKTYNADKPQESKVYVMLIKLLLNPDQYNINLPGVTLSPKTAQVDLETALKLLEDYACCINPLDVLDVLPDNIPVSRIYKFLQIAMQQSLKERRRVQLLKGLLYAEHLQCQEMRLHLESENVLITDMNICPVCKKRFGKQSALVRYPNGDVVHYSCQDRKL